jgi:hypothetical protein
MRNAPRAKKERIGIGQWEKRMEGKKTRTLEYHKGAATKTQKLLKAGPPASGAPGSRPRQREHS